MKKVAPGCFCGIFLSLNHGLSGLTDSTDKIRAIGVIPTYLDHGLHGLTDSIDKNPCYPCNPDKSVTLIIKYRAGYPRQRCKSFPLR